MRVLAVDGKEYRLPGGLNDFQFRLYIHLIQWKWNHITREPGIYEYGGKHIPYDAMLPRSKVDDLPLIHPTIRKDLLRHRKRNPFRLHLHFNHMASSQAAIVNLLLPILTSPQASTVLASLRPDFASLATDYLDNGYCLEYWGGNFDANKESIGPLGDKSVTGGTDCDLAIAYRNRAGELCLWLLEHKLTESEFTPCGGFRSKGRVDKVRHDCSQSFSSIIGSKQFCYHHDVRKRQYWRLTEVHADVFANHQNFAHCPFRGGLNQLWRNQLLGMAIARDATQPFRHAHFSVVHHPSNTALQKPLADYGRLISNHPTFSVITSEKMVAAAEKLGDTQLNAWAKWYRELYSIPQ